MGEYKYNNNPNYKIVNCSYCKKQIGRRKIKENNIYFCNPSCQVSYEYKNNLRDLKGIHTTHENLRIKAREKLKKGVKYFNRRISSDGYWQVYVPLSGWKKEHIYLWELKNGGVKKGYELHHIDGDKLNNNLNNLVTLTKQEHLKLHNQSKKRDYKGRFID